MGSIQYNKYLQTIWIGILPPGLGRGKEFVYALFAINSFKKIFLAPQTSSAWGKHPRLQPFDRDGPDDSKDW